MIREKYWKESDRKTYFNSEAVMFELAERPDSDSEFRFENNSEWSFNPDKVLTDSVMETKFELTEKARTVQLMY